MRGLTDEQKAEARCAYESGEAMASIAKRLNVRRPTLIAARDREGWIVQPSVQVSVTESRAVRERATAQIIDMASRRIVERAASSGVIDTVAEYAAQNLAAHGKFVNSLTSALQYAVDRFNFDPSSVKLGIGKNEADYINSLADAGKKIMAMGRDSAGLRPGDISKPTTEIDQAEQTVGGIRKDVVQRPIGYQEVSA